MELLKVIKNRRSIRKFDQQKQVEDYKIEKLLDTACWAPSAGNLQSYLLIVVKQADLKKKLYEAALFQDSILQASVVLVACADLTTSASKYGHRGRNLYSVQDATLATLIAWLAAVDMGLSAVWIGAFDENRLAKILKLSKNLRPVAILPIGYPAESPAPPPRRSISEISKQI